MNLREPILDLLDHYPPSDILDEVARALEADAALEIVPETVSRTLAAARVIRESARTAARYGQ